MAERKGVMLAYPLNEHRLSKFPKNILVQPKIDGNRCRAKYVNGKYQLISSSGAIIPFLPHINDELLKIACKRIHWLSDEWKISWPQFDGELYNHGLSHQEINGIVRRTENISPDYHLVEYHIFDLINHYDQEYRFHMLDDYLHFEEFELYTKINWVATRYTVKENWQFYLAKFMDQGYEGIILRNPLAKYEPKRSLNLLKYKPTHESRFTITDAIEAIDIQGQPKDMLGAVRCIDEKGKRFKVGAGCLSHDERVMWWMKGNLNGCIAIVKFRTVTKDGIPREAVLMDIVEED
ncbi:hypothetical protein LCGC14_1817580 [marine sediment metagenome]|uniref:ATP-dependent DNA ligase family profile domain-containing protein n=1 Tax=marine sediment metagenome TaxID=412755 RepID=A0A0F9GJX8_9ZZZZ